MSDEFWNGKSLDEQLNAKIQEEAFLHYKRNGWKSDLQNWYEAKSDVMDRIRFIAYYLHESNIDKSPLDNWVEAEKIYIENF